MRGARAVQTSIFHKFRDANIGAAIVWMKMLPDDSETMAQKAAATFDDPRVRHFYDPAKSAGIAIAAGLNRTGNVAWDIYLFYEAGPEWTEAPPPPTSWMHQLKDSWADPQHFRTGDDLVRELFITMKKLCNECLNEKWR